ncbi:MAG: glycosyltransferase family 2 protein [Candidatus Saccharimonadia bacterium]
MSAPLFSVVVPAFNTSATIEETISSILGQTCSDYEIIVVDDGSPDNVGDVVAKLYGNRVKLIRQLNKGLAGARNTGIDHSKGKFVAFLDSDDCWLPNKLAVQADQITNHPETDVFYANCYFWESDHPTKLWTDIHGQKNGHILAELINRSVMLPVLTAVVRRQTLVQVGKFDDSLRQVEDYDLWLRLCVNGSNFYSTPEPLALYRLNPAGLSQNRLQMASTQLEVYHKLLRNPSLPRPMVSLVTSQINLFSRERIGLERSAALESGQRVKAASKTLSLSRFHPQAIPKHLVTAAGILLAPKYVARHLNKASGSASSNLL